MPNNKLHVKKDDVVMVLSGKDKGKKGKILSALPREGKILVEGVNVSTKHVKPRKQGQPGGRITKESYIYSSKVLPVCGKCGKPTRVRHAIEDGKKIRVCGCGAPLD